MSVAPQDTTGNVIQFAEHQKARRRPRGKRTFYVWIPDTGTFAHGMWYNDYIKAAASVVRAMKQELLPSRVIQIIHRDTGKVHAEVVQSGWGGRKITVKFFHRRDS